MSQASRRQASKACRSFTCERNHDESVENQPQARRPQPVQPPSSRISPGFSDVPPSCRRPSRGLLSISDLNRVGPVQPDSSLPEHQTPATGPSFATGLQQGLTLATHESDSQLGGGYEAEFAPRLEDKHKCPICLLALREPVQTNCGHRFCRTCIQPLRQQRARCSLDREPVKKLPLDSCPFTLLRCSHWDRGCREQVLETSLQVHITSECEYRDSFCTQCRSTLPLNELETPHVNAPVERMDAIVADLNLRQISQETTIFGGVLVWKLPNFDRHFKEASTGRKQSLYSPPFYTSRHGYKMCAKVYLYGDGVGKGSHMSIFLVVMRGEFDALLPWPFRQKVTLTLLDQSPTMRHISESFIANPSSSSFQRPSSELNIASGRPRFVAIDTLRAANGYIRDNTILLRVAIDCTGLQSY